MSNTFENAKDDSKIDGRLDDCLSLITDPIALWPVFHDPTLHSFIELSSWRLLYVEYHYSLICFAGNILLLMTDDKHSINLKIRISSPVYIQSQFATNFTSSITEVLSRNFNSRNLNPIEHTKPTIKQHF